MSVRIVRFLYPRKKYGNIVAFFDVEYCGRQYKNFRLVKQNNRMSIDKPKEYLGKHFETLMADKVFKDEIEKGVKQAMNVIQMQKNSLKSSEQIALEKHVEKAAHVWEKFKYDKTTGKVKPKINVKQSKNQPVKESMKIEESKKFLPPEWANNQAIKEMRKEQYKEMKERYEP